MERPPAEHGSLAHWLEGKPTVREDRQSGFRLLDTGREAFQWRVKSARKAEDRLYIQTYIWRDDVAGGVLLGELLKAADRGVEVALLLDDLDLRGSEGLLTQLHQHPNIQVRVFNPFRTRHGLVSAAVEFLFRGHILNHRMHNKAWVADGRLAIIGGRNIGNEYFEVSDGYNFTDLDLVMVGPLASAVEHSFIEYWNSSASIELERMQDTTRHPEALSRYRAELDAWKQKYRTHPLMELAPLNGEPLEPSILDADAYTWTTQADFVVDDVAKARRHQEPQRPGVAQVLHDRMASAEEELLIISPYFVPGREGTRQLATLAEHGVRVSVLTNSLAANDVAFTHSGYSRRRSALLEAGVELHELRPTALPQEFLGNHGPGGGSASASLHAKAVVIDRREAFIGSFNLDPRSQHTNTESGVLLRDPELVAKTRALYAYATRPELAYRVELDDEGWPIWTDDAGTVYRTDPKAGIWQRIISALTHLAPVEPLL